MALPTALYYSPSSASHDTARACGAPVFLPGPDQSDATPYAFKQEWIQKNSAWTAVARNTAHPDATYNTFLLQDETERADIGGGLVVWTRTYAKKPDEWSDYESFPWLMPGFFAANTSQGNNGERDPDTINVNSRLAKKYYLVGTGGDYASANLIPLLEPQKYYLAGNSAYLLTRLGAGSVPTKDEYIGSIIGTEIVVEGSFITRWMGNIWERTTRYVTAI